MGVGLAIGATLLGGYLNGRAQQQAAKAQAQQAEANAQIAFDNAEKLEKQAEQQAQNNAINEENKRRRLKVSQGRNIAAIGAAGITASGSAANALADSAFNSEMDLAIERYNGRQKVDNYFQASTDSYNQGNVYKWNAEQYRKAGKRAMMNSMLQSGLSLAGSLYSPKSEGMSGAQSYGVDGYKWGGNGSGTFSYKKPNNEFNAYMTWGGY